jgi:hypothetical protein
LKICDEYTNENAWVAGGIRKYCPDFQKEDFIFGDYYSEKQSWYRVIIEACNPDIRKCKNQIEIDDYFEKTIVGFSLINEKPSLVDFTLSRPLVKSI